MKPEVSPVSAVVIGGSAGSLEALSRILVPLPADFAAPILVVVHVPPGKPSVLAELLQAKSRLRVKEAEDKEPILPGTVYFAPPDYHLLVETGGSVALSCDEPLMFSRPSIDVLFESAADVYEDGLVAIVLSGANSDGANGLAAVQKFGGKPIVQSPASAFSAAMPEAALEKCPEALQLTPDEIAGHLERIHRHES